MNKNLKIVLGIICVTFHLFAFSQNEDKKVVELENKYAIMTFDFQETINELSQRQAEYEDTVGKTFINAPDLSYFKDIMTYMDTCENPIKLNLDSTYNENDINASLIDEIEWTSYELLKRGKGIVYFKKDKMKYNKYTSQDVTDVGTVSTEFRLDNGNLFWKVYTIIY